MNHPPPLPQAVGPAISRLADVMAHINRYSFRGTARLAEDSGVSPSYLSRLINSRRAKPSSLIVARITAALEGACGLRIDPRDLVAEHGRFLTRHVCDVVGCRGCLPSNAYDEFGDLKPTFADVKPGQWLTSQFPHGDFRKGADAR